MGFWLTIDSKNILQRTCWVPGAVAGLGEFLFAEKQNSFSSAFGSLIAYNFALYHTNEENTTAVVVHDMELVCICPTLNSPEQAFLGEVPSTQIMVLLSSLQKVATPTLHPHLPSVSVSEIIKQIVHLVSEFLVSDVSCRNKASVELCILENKHTPCHGLLGRFELLEGGLFPKVADYQLIIVNLFHKIVDLCRQVMLHSECMTFFTSPVPPALGHILSIRV